MASTEELPLVVGRAVVGLVVGLVVGIGVVVAKRIRIFILQYRQQKHRDQT